MTTLDSSSVLTTTSTSVADLAGDAATLVAYACQPRLKPFNHERYGHLLARYRADPAFRDISDAVAEGFGLITLAAHDSEGLLLAPTADSPFSLRLGDMNIASDKRILVGLIHIAIAARVYPTPADLDSDTVRRASIEDIDKFIRQVCQALRHEGTDDTGLDLGRDLDATWRAYDAMPDVRYSEARNRRAQLLPACTHYWVKFVFAFLVQQGYAQPADRLGDGVYRLLHKFRLQVAETAGTEALEALRTHARSVSAGQTSDTTSTGTAGTTEMSLSDEQER